jgi:hypothetical protein
MKKLISTLILIISMAWPAFSQNTGLIKGFVVDATNGEPIISALVKVEDTKLQTQTDVNGFFSIPKIAAGTYNLIITFNNYEPKTEQITIAEGEIVSKKIELTKKVATAIGGVTISARKQEKVNNTSIALTKINSKEIKALPSIGGEPDIAQYLQVLPGVTFSGDQGGQLYIRGGSPIQNKILLDGMTIYNPFHSIGLFSVFETEGIRNADVMSGGFGVEYGDRTSAIVSVNTKDGNKVRHSGKIGVSPILAKLFVEGPLLKSKVAGGPTITYVAAIKNSYLDKTSKFYAPLNETFSGNALPFSFNDIYAKICLNSGANGKLNIFGFNFDDNVNFAESKYNWNNIGLGANFVLSPSTVSSLITGGLYYNNYVVGLQESDGRVRESKIGGFDANLAITSFLPNNHELKYGFEVAGFNTLFEYYNFLNVKSDINEYTTQLGGFAKYKANFNSKFIIEGGFRFQYYASLSRFSPEPRVAFKYNLSKNLRFKGAIGRYSQNLISTKNDRDIVNLFTGFLTGPEGDLFKFNKNVSNNDNIQYANHYIGGIELDINKMEFTLEPWYKDFTQLIGFNRYKLLGSDPDFLIESGQAYGIDLSAKYAVKKINIWTVFSLGNLTRNDGRQTYPPPFDRRYNINLVGTYIFGKKSDWEVSARFNYGSAFPFTLTQAFYENIDFSQQGLNTNYLTQNGSLGFIYDNKINAGRLSDYHRLDASIKKKIEFSKNNNLEITASVTNMYNRQNIFYINRITNARNYQLPFFPTLAVGWNF